MIDEYTCSDCENHMEIFLQNGRGGDPLYCPWCKGPLTAGSGSWYEPFDSGNDDD